MHIGTSSYLFSSSMVPAIGCLGDSIMPATGLYSVSRLVWNLVGGLRLNYYRVAFKSHLGRRRIGARLVYSGSSMVPAAGSYSKGQSSPLYTVVTTGRAVEVSCSAAGRAARVCLFSCRRSSRCRL